ncbi:hypothetical protein CHS0354_024101 [Potamilus streckersoni]|uniref:DNA-3-methyladenine glycosylase I n=1 Tax=Potamilus streckersoni TaxID=2493646 RepID=A0AAE0RZD7_9BIVA|nr:hypothetical protein CHS0354_024101 [Potamilus streckersoni]
MIEQTKIRCTWCGNDPLYVAYHDDEWGRPVFDDKIMFEFMILETFQAGLSWLTILRKRDAFRVAFDEFDVAKVANYDEKKVVELMQNAGIVRNQLKIRAAIHNASRFIEIQKSHGNFTNYLWAFVDGKPLLNHPLVQADLPVSTPLSDTISKDLQNRGFKFVGSTIVYAKLQAVGIVNDHLESSKYVNPFTDFGFKKIFGEEASKSSLIDFLNALLPKEDNIADLSFKNPEQLGRSEAERKAVFDIYCENAQGEKFIVELQKAKQNYFKERTIYYSTFPIREQAEKGIWNFNLSAVYCVGILDFTFDDYKNDAEKNEVLHTIKLKNQHGNVFYDKLTYIYLEMPNFRKKQEELKTRLDYWLYFIKYLEDFQSIPSMFKDAVFEQAFEKAELAKLGQAEMDKYEYSLKVFRDNKNTFDYAVETAFGEGMLEGKLERNIEIIVKKYPHFGIEQLAALTDLSVDEVRRILKEHKVL